MTYSVFDFYQNAANGLSWLGGAEGTPEAHTLLTSPLTTEGDYCRQMFAANGNNTNGNMQHLIKTSAVGGVFNEIPNTKSLSLRAWVRSAPAVLSTNGASCVGLCAKSQVISSATGDAFGAYKLRLGGIGGTTTSITRLNSTTLRLSVTNDSTGFLSTSSSEVICTGTYASNVWYKIRLDIIPLGGYLVDRLIAYTGTGVTGSEVWTEVGRIDVLDSIAGYRAWGNAAHRYGYYASRNSSASSGTAANHNSYISRFQALLQTN